MLQASEETMAGTTAGVCLEHAWSIPRCNVSREQSPGSTGQSSGGQAPSPGGAGRVTWILMLGPSGLSLNLSRRGAFVGDT